MSEREIMKDMNDDVTSYEEGFEYAVMYWTGLSWTQVTEWDREWPYHDGEVPNPNDKVISRPIEYQE